MINKLDSLWMKLSEKGYELEVLDSKDDEYVDILVRQKDYTDVRFKYYADINSVKFEQNIYQSEIELAKDILSVLRIN